MTSDVHSPVGSEPDVTAAELALGVLEGEERAAALRRVLAEPGFAREVERWRAHFAALFDAVVPVRPAANVEERIIGAIEGKAPKRAAASYWRPFALASSLAAASLLAVVVTRPTPVAPPIVNAAPAPMVAAFMISGHSDPIVATYDSRSGRLSMPGPMPIPAGKSAQLWAIVGSQAPQPLGLFHQAGSRVEAEARSPEPMKPGTTLAISFEPLGGSPTGLPTGPVVGSATLIRA